MPQNDIEYRASLNDDEVIKALQNIERHLIDISNIGDDQFQELQTIAKKSFKGAEQASKKAHDSMQKDAKKTGAVIGFVSGVIQDLTRRLINMAQRVPQAFGAVIGATLDANKLFEQFSTQFTTLLGGTEAAQGRVQELVEFNIKTPFELPEIVEASRVLQIFGGDVLATGENLRMVGDIAAGVNRPIEEVGLWIGRAYDALQSGRPFGVAALALQRMGALSGTARAELERMQKEGVKGEEAWQRFNELVGTRFAGNMERLAQTLVGIQSNLADFRTELLRLSGEELFENIKEDAQRLLDILTKQREPLTELGVGFGEVAAAMERMVTSGILDQLEELDPEHVEDLADAMGRFADALERTSDKEMQGDINDLVDILSSLVDTITSLINLTTIFTRTGDKLKAKLEEMGLVGEIVVNTVEELEMVFTRITNPLAAMISLVDDATEAWRKLSDQYERVHGFRLDTLLQDVAKATDVAAGKGARRVAPRRGKGAAPEILDPIIPSLDEFDEQADELADAYEKLGDRLADLAIDREREIADIIREYGDKQLDEAIKNADKRIDLARANADKIEDIYRKHQQDIADAGTDLSRAEADIARKAARDRVEVERDTARERIDIETDYRRELQRIRDRFNQSAAEAERNNDAQAYLAAMRRRDVELTEAKRDRAENIEDAATRAAEQREEVNRQLQYEIEDARIANQRKLEDLQLRLNRELEAQQINYDRDLEQQALNEERKRAEMQRSYELELRDFAIKEFQRVADLQRSLAKEFKLIQAHERNIRNLRIAEAQKARDALNALSRFNPFGTSASARRSTYASTLASSFGRRQEGGPVEPGRPYIVGERGPELFVPAQAGAVMANVVNLPAPTQAGAVSNVSTSLSNSFNVSESIFNDPVAVRRLQNIIMETVAGVI